LISPAHNNNIDGRKHRENFRFSITKEQILQWVHEENNQIVIDKDLFAQMVHSAQVAISGGNSQPWAISGIRCGQQARISSIVVEACPTQSYIVDIFCVSSFIACGSVLENLVQCSLAAGLVPTAELLPASAKLSFQKASGSPIPNLADQIHARQTNRYAPRLNSRTPDSVLECKALLLDTYTLARTHYTSSILAKNNCQSYHMSMGLITDEVVMDNLGDLMGTVEQLRFLNPKCLSELLSEVAFSHEKHIGIPVEDFGLKKAEQELMKIVLQRKEAISILYDQARQSTQFINIGKKFSEQTVKNVHGSLALVVMRVSMPITEARFYSMASITTGAIIQRLLLQLQKSGYACQPITTLPYLVNTFRMATNPHHYNFETLSKTFTQTFSEVERAEIAKISTKWMEIQSQKVEWLEQYPDDTHVFCPLIFRVFLPQEHPEPQILNKAAL
jgi:hypothetical protein